MLQLLDKTVVKRGSWTADMPKRAIAIPLHQTAAPSAGNGQLDAISEACRMHLHVSKGTAAWFGTSASDFQHGEKA